MSLIQHTTYSPFLFFSSNMFYRTWTHTYLPGDNWYLHTHSRLQKMSFLPFPLLKQETHGSNACTNVIYEDYYYSFPMFVFLAQTGPAATAVYGQNFGGFSGTVFLGEGGSPVSRQQPTVSKHSALPPTKIWVTQKRSWALRKYHCGLFRLLLFYVREICLSISTPPPQRRGRERQNQWIPPPLAWGVNATWCLFSLLCLWGGYKRRPLIREKEREKRHPPLLPRQRLFDSFSSFAFIRRPTATRSQGTKEKNGIRQYLARFTRSNLNMQGLTYVSKSCQKLTKVWSNLSGMLAQTVDSPLASLFAWSSGKGIPPSLSLFPL